MSDDEEVLQHMRHSGCTLLTLYIPLQQSRAMIYLKIALHNFVKLQIGFVREC